LAAFFLVSIYDLRKYFNSTFRAQKDILAQKKLPIHASCKSINFLPVCPTPARSGKIWGYKSQQTVLNVPYHFHDLQDAMDALDIGRNPIRARSSW